MHIIVKIIIAVITGYILKWYIKRYKISLLFDKLPGPATVPFFGNLLPFLGNNEQVWLAIRKHNELYGKLFRIWTPHYIVVNVRDPDDLEIVFNNIKCITKSEIYHALQPWLRTGLLTSTGRKWQTRRKILTPAFHFNILQKYLEVVVKHSKRMVEELQAEESEAIRKLESWISDHTLDIICETAMGISRQDLDEDLFRKYKNAVLGIGFIVSHRIMRPWLVPNILFYLSPYNWKQRRLLKILHDFSRKIINERKKYHQKTEGRFLADLNNNNNEDITMNSKGRKRLAMLDLLIAAYQEGQIDDEGIQEEVDTFIFEGFDTTAMALVHTILLLAEHTEHQEIARKEIIQVWDECNGKITMNELPKLTYLERCIKESLRLYPSVPLIGRHMNHELKLKNFTLPAGIMMNIHIFDTHRDPDHWPDPHKFDPDRFLTENVKLRHPFAYIPFSGGFRNCIGQKFAMLEMKTFISYLLYHFKLEPIETTKDIRFKTDLVLRNLKSLRVKFIPLNKVKIN